MRLRREVGIVAVGLIAAVALIFPLAGISGAPRGPSWKASVPFTETVFNSSTAESVTLTGVEALTLRVTGNIITGWNTSLKATLRKTTGIGGSSGGRYKAKGTTTLTAAYPPERPPTSPTTYQATFTLYPPRAACPGGCSRTPVLVPVTITLKADGSVGSVYVGHSG
jgi:hypothetical protein